MNERVSRSVARMVMRAPVVHPKKAEEVGKEVIFVVRPGWSNVGKYEFALPGGKIEEIDFLGGAIPAEISDAELRVVALRAVVREIAEELGISLSHELLRFVTESTNDSGWTSLVYATDLPQKPATLVYPDSAGTLWLPQEGILAGEYQLFADHGELIIPALNLLISQE